MQPNTWNFNACQGCDECGCGAASKSQQCDLVTGKCECLPTVTGKRCDWCELGYHSYTENGCTSELLISCFIHFISNIIAMVA